jgi:hypothetical protein
VYIINTDDVKPPSSLRRGNQVGEAENEGEKEPPLVLYTSRRRSSTDAAQAAWALPLCHLDADGSSHWATSDWPRLILSIASSLSALSPAVSSRESTLYRLGCPAQAMTATFTLADSLTLSSHIAYTHVFSCGRANGAWRRMPPVCVYQL